MKIIDPNSPMVQAMGKLSDIIICNIMFVIFSLPIFTIGAAQTALYTGIKTLLDPEDDTYCSAAFFKGFKTGFKQITIAWCLLGVLVAILGAVTLLCIYYTGSYNSIQFWSAIIGLGIVALFQSLLPLFHARFNCTAMQLIRNAWFLALAHPIRSLFVAAVTWLPVILFVTINFVDFMTITPIFLLIYFSGTYLFGFSYMKKPFQVLIDHYNETHGITPPPAAEEEIEEE